jgi:trans-aconitate 2-methyltransferase
MIAQAKKSFSDVKNLRFIEASAENFEFDIQFDLIVSFFALHYVIDHLIVLKKIYNALKPAGTFIAMMSGGEQPEVAKVFGSNKWKNLIVDSSTTWGSKTEAEYRPLIEQAGFANIETKTISARFL